MLDTQLKHSLLRRELGVAGGQRMKVESNLRQGRGAAGAGLTAHVVADIMRITREEAYNPWLWPVGATRARIEPRDRGFLG